MPRKIQLNFTRFFQIYVRQNYPLVRKVDKKCSGLLKRKQNKRKMVQLEIKQQIFLSREPTLSFAEKLTPRIFYLPTYVSPESLFSRAIAQPVEGENWYTFGDQKAWYQYYPHDVFNIPEHPPREAINMRLFFSQACFSSSHECLYVLPSEPQTWPPFGVQSGQIQTSLLSKRTQFAYGGHVFLVHSVR